MPNVLRGANQKLMQASRLEFSAQLAVVFFLVGGCWLVIQPFASAVVFSIIMAVSTWPAYEWLVRRLHGRKRTAAVLACFVTVALAVGSAAFLVTSLIDGVGSVVGMIKGAMKDGAASTPPHWLTTLPWIGDRMQSLWSEMLSRRVSVGDLLQKYAEPAREFAFAGGKALGNIMTQAAIIMLVLYFLYHKGHVLAARTRQAADRIGGAFGCEMLDTAARTVVGVMLSIIGAALAQAAVAAIGFMIAGVPNAFLLAALTFALSMVPIGPPLVWGGVCIWLFQQGHPGWGIFMLIYGFFGISSIDNVLKPFIISRSNQLPFVLTFIGVIGGLVAFGVIGIFLGPTLLALAINLGAHWLDRDESGSGEMPANQSTNSAS